MTDIKLVENLFKIALNIKPKHHINNGTRTKNMEIINAGVIELQKRLIGYDCLKAAVMLSDDNKAIAEKTDELIRAQLAVIANGENK